MQWSFPVDERLYIPWECVNKFSTRQLLNPKTATLNVNVPERLFTVRSLCPLIHQKISDASLQANHSHSRLFVSLHNGDYLGWQKNSLDKNVVKNHQFNPIAHQMSILPSPHPLRAFLGLYIWLHQIPSSFPPSRRIESDTRCSFTHW